MNLKAMRHTSLTMSEKYGDVVDGRIDEALAKVSELAFANSTPNSTRGKLNH